MNFKEEKEGFVKHWKKTKSITDERVLTAYMKVPREEFVLKEYQEEAYHDHPLPTLNEQTISQPSVVLTMTEHLHINEGEHVLEIGSGSGYQAAILSVLVGEKGSVVTVESDKDLAVFSHKNLSKYTNVTTILVDDNTIGYPARAPYDKIVVTAAVPEIPHELYDQLKDGGRIVAPVGTQYSQEMFAVEKITRGKYNIERLGVLQFVPLQGKFGYS